MDPMTMIIIEIIGYWLGLLFKGREANVVTVNGTSFSRMLTPYKYCFLRWSMYWKGCLKRSLV